ncbi:MAG: transcription-repair coupling factor [Rhodospirillales bacterium]|nr:MAG: transcription-repair coupling factor [Rhodospirillales bacterium]
MLLSDAAAGSGARPILHIARDDSRMVSVARDLGFVTPDLDVRTFPAWDCLPYDRVSPNAEIIARRLDLLSRLAQGGATPSIVVTTVSAVLQKLPPREALADAILSLEVGGQIPQGQLLSFFADAGYRRAATVREPGEFAVRGGIIDVFPPGEPEPLRLDFFGDELEAVRRFDAMTQRGTGTEEDLVLRPVSEVPLTETAIQRFRHEYRQLFGATTEADPLYEAISAGQRHVGMEHWLPLFYERLETLLDYLPDAAVTLDHQIEETTAARFKLIDEYFQARTEMLPANQREARSASGSAPVYKPVPPGRMFVDRPHWEETLSNRPVVSFAPFALPAEGSDIADAGGRQVNDFAAARAAPDVQLFDAVRDRLAADAGKRTVVITAHTEGSRDRLVALLAEHGAGPLVKVDAWRDALRQAAGTIAVAVAGFEHGFSADDLVVYSEQDILGERIGRLARRRRRPEEFISEYSTLSTGDLVVHVDHGIGRYDGLETVTVERAPHDCLRLLYHGGDKLYVPVENLDVLSRFGSEDAEIPLDRLGSPAWQARKARAKDRIRDIAAQLLRVAAEREVREGVVLEAPQGAYDEFAARFSWTETDDQIRAIDDTISDLASGRPMDRLICGDVGFGKTEVALRATFIAASHGYQVAIIVPTTLLARQHYANFRDRFAGLPFRIAQLSRLITGAAAARVKRGMAEGDIHVVIGTHALLAKGIRFANLGLLVIDEEQHFGVAQKERLKQLKSEVHVLTLTATPIPRTLQMALAGVREMSVIATPPVDRLAIRTFVLPYDPVIVREAILREKARGGRTFYVCPRIADLSRVLARVTELLPEATVGVAHGRMPAKQLEQTMTEFLEGRYDILLSTNIIESGLDIPEANTMIVHRADRFGLAQLYQMRGRIGRSKIRAYAYLTLPPGQLLSPSAQKRLEVMQTLDTLGAGFTLASHDLDIRGAGNLLGEEQSGQIREIGVELYQHLLQEAVAAAGADSRQTPEERWTPIISLGTPILIPEDYVSDLSVRLGLYRRLAHLVEQAEIDGFAAELIDRFGPLPEAVENLLQIITIKQLCRQAGVEKLEAGPKGAVIAFRNDQFTRPEALIDFIQRQSGTVRLRPDHRLVYLRGWDDPRLRATGVQRLLEQLARLAVPQSVAV